MLKSRLVSVVENVWGYADAAGVPELRRTGGLVETRRIQASTAEVVALCRKYHIRQLSVFGSVLREDYGPTSDIDVLVEFEPGRVPGFAFFRIQDELSQLLGRDVDLHTAKSLSRYFRDEAKASAEVLCRRG